MSCCTEPTALAAVIDSLVVLETGAIAARHSFWFAAARAMASTFEPSHF